GFQPAMKLLHGRRAVRPAGIEPAGNIAEVEYRRKEIEHAFAKVTGPGSDGKGTGERSHKMLRQVDLAGRCRHEFSSGSVHSDIPSGVKPGPEAEIPSSDLTLRCLTTGFLRDLDAPPRIPDLSHSGGGPRLSRHIRRGDFP